MRAVADTNIVVSGLLWHGRPRRVLDQARAERVELFTSPALLAELLDVLSRPKLSRRLAAAGLSAHELTSGYAALARIVVPVPIGEQVIRADPEDDEVLACAIAARAEAVVPGDRHLLDLGSFYGVPILTTDGLLQRLV
jgi:uncharacterized protein